MAIRTLHDCGFAVVPHATYQAANAASSKKPQGRRTEGAATSTKELTQPPSVKQDKSLKRARPQVIDLTRSSTNTPKHPAKKRRRELYVDFIHGKDEHIDIYADCIDEAESQIIITSWNLNFIPSKIFSSLMEAKKRGVYISFVVQSVKREETLDYFYDDEDSSSDDTFSLFETKSHAKFLFVDSKILVLGSYNALGDSYEESLDASVMVEGTVRQMWPFYMSIYETYISMGEDLGDIFGPIAGASKARHPGPRPLLRRSFEDTSYIFLLRTIQEHEEFFKLATPDNGDVSIYSPFSTRDNTLKRLQALQTILPAATRVSLKVLPRFRSGLIGLLARVPKLQDRVNVETVSSHQKVMILGTETICIGSLNWLSAAQDSKAPYSNVELSIVLQGPRADNIIKEFYSVNSKG